MSIRKLESSDASEYYRLRLEALVESPAFFGESDEEFSQKSIDSLAKTISERNKEDCNFLLGAFDVENILIGMVGIAQQKGVKREHYCILWGMYVTPSARGQRVGKSLVEEAIRLSRQTEAIEGIKLCVEVSNTAAKQLYRSIGFSTYGTEPKAMKLQGHYYDEHMMVLDFNADKP